MSHQSLHCPICSLDIVEQADPEFSISRLVAGAVAETPNASDGRQKILSITNSGKQTLSKIDSIADEQLMKALMILPANSLPE
jgi:hypothetical protein